jgi:integrase
MLTPITTGAAAQRAQGEPMPKKFEGVQRRGKSSFRIHYTDATGARHFETVEAADMESAARIRTSRLADADKGIPVAPRPHRITFEELAEDVIADYENNDYTSIADQRARLRLHLNPAFGKRRAAGITTADIRRYIRDRRQEGAANGTINRELELMRHAFILAIEEGRLFHRPEFPMLEENNVRQGFFESAQFESVCRGLPEHYADFARFGYITGWRRQEIARLHWANIHPDVVRLEPGTTKNREGRNFPITADLRKVLDRREAARKALLKEDPPILTPLVFWYRAGKKSKMVRPIGNFSDRWAEACKAAGIAVAIEEKTDKAGRPYKTIQCARIFHDFRRTAYRNLVRLGVPEKVAREAVGWKDPKTADRYNVTSAADLDVLRDILDSRGRPQTPGRKTE